MSDENSLIEARCVRKIYGAGTSRVAALDGVSVAIRRNEFFTLLGPSGCGKTTLLRLIAGFEAPDEGQILLDGADIAALPPHLRPINTVFQSYALFPHLTVAQNIAFGLENLGRSRSEASVRVAEMLALVRLDAQADRKPGQLSGGQQQRVALARALAPAPRLLLLDEPLSALDLKLRKGMQIELKRLQSETGITFVFVTHDQEEALTMSDRIAVMGEGTILQIGTPAEIYEAPRKRFVADFIGEINLLDARVISPGRVDAGLGAEIEAIGGGSPGARVTVAIRPERIGLGPAAADLPYATVESVIYQGTDTVYLMRAPKGAVIRARLQNREGAAQHFRSGSKVSLAIARDAARTLED